MNISNFCSQITKLVNENEFLNANILFGNLNRDGIMNLKIKEDIFCRFKSFIESRYNMENKKIKIYHMNDTKLYSYNNNTHICIRELPIKYSDFNINNYKRNNDLSFRLICKNQRMIDNINFPSITKYDNIDLVDIDFCNIKYKNSEIILEFHEYNDISSISIKTKIDKYNISNFIQNFQFIISKLLIKKINLDPQINNSYKKNSYKKNSYKKNSYKKNSYKKNSYKKNSFKNEHL